MALIAVAHSMGGIDSCIIGGVVQTVGKAHQAAYYKVPNVNRGCLYLSCVGVKIFIMAVIVSVGIVAIEIWKEKEGEEGIGRRGEGGAAREVLSTT